MVISHTDISPSDADLGRRVLVVARSIAPCIDTLSGDSWYDAVAILKGVVAEVIGPHGVAAERIGPASVTYRDVGSRFSAEARSSLRSLCDASSLPSGLPVGSFPRSGVVTNLWPEDC